MRKSDVDFAANLRRPHVKSVNPYQKSRPSNREHTPVAFFMKTIIFQFRQHISFKI